jgi:ubiquinone/menaquinone biosynthesis C-methylase UbiE
MSMAVVRLRSYLEDYRHKALHAELHELSGRGSKKDRTEFVNARIVRGLQLQPLDLLLDIGCGDGCLLRMVHGKVAVAVGTVPTQEEEIRLRNLLPDVELKVGFVQNLPLKRDLASKIVCNSVILLLETKQEVEKSLREIARVARAGALIWVGEVPEADEFAAYGHYRGDSILGMLWFLLLRQGPRPFLGMIRRLGRAWSGKEEVVLHAHGHYFAEPREFLKLAEQCGLALVEYFRHQEACDLQGNPIDSKFRYDYVFTKLP